MFLTTTTTPSSNLFEPLQTSSNLQTDVWGNVVVADDGNNVVYNITLDNKISIIAGKGTNGGTIAAGEWALGAWDARN